MRGWKKYAAFFAFCFCVTFVIFRFDIRRLGVSFQHPMPTATAALVAIVGGIVGVTYLWVRDN